MAQTVTPPKEQVPLGYVVIQGQRYEVAQHPEIVRFFASLVTRVGGVSGSSTTDLTVSQFEDAGIEEIRAQFLSFIDESKQTPSSELIPMDLLLSELIAMREQVAELQKSIQDIQQGVML